MSENYKLTIMKELSIEGKAKRYDEAVINGSRLWECGEITREDYEYIFPELKESEDERILRRIINIVDEYSAKHQIDNTDCIDWLEKQGEHANFRNKIQIGDKVTRNEDGVIVNLSQLNRVAKKDEKQGEQKPAEWHRENEQNLNTCLGYIPDEFLRRWLTDVIHVKYDKPTTDFSDLRTWKYIVDAVWTEKEGIGQYLDSPFTEEVAKKLQKRFGHIEQSKQEWSEEDKNMLKWVIGYLENKMLNTPISEERTACKNAIAWLEEKLKGEQKPAWDEGDEVMVNSIISFCNFKVNAEKGNEGVVAASRNILFWLNKLQYRVQPQPKQEWSEEDEKMIESIIDTINTAISECDVDDIGAKARFSLEKERDWLKNRLKSLRPQSQWKPSDEQMEALLKLEEMHVIEHENNQENAHLYMVVKSIREQLLKLREE